MISTTKIYSFSRKLLYFLMPLIILCSLLIMSIRSGADAINYQWQWDRVPQYLAYYEDGEWWHAELLEGLLLSLQISTWALLGSLIIGLITALLRLSNSIVGRYLALSYIEIIRNTPLLIQIYLLYFVLAPLLNIDRFNAAVLSLVIFQGAYTAEVFRAGLNSIDKGQFEAAKVLGLSNFTTYRYIILPQVMLKILPVLTNEMISLIKNSSILSVMAIFELTTQARNIIAETAMPFEIWFTVAGLYLLIILPLTAISVLIERKISLHKN